MTTSIASFLEKTKPNNGPFASKNVFYESDTTHSEKQKGTNFVSFLATYMKYLVCMGLISYTCR